MAKRTTQPEAAVSAEPRKIRATKPRTASAAHKHTAKKTTDIENETTAKPVSTPSTDEIARLAYSYWVARGYQGGSPDDDWFRAERELLELT